MIHAALWQQADRPASELPALAAATAATPQPPNQGYRPIRHRSIVGRFSAGRQDVPNGSALADNNQKPKLDKTFEVAASRVVRDRQFGDTPTTRDFTHPSNMGQDLLLPVVELGVNSWRYHHPRCRSRHLEAVQITGGILLVHGLKRVCGLADRIGIHAVTVHALNASAKRFSEAHGFLPLRDDPFHLFLPMATIRKL